MRGLRGVGRKWVLGSPFISGLRISSGWGHSSAAAQALVEGVLRRLKDLNGSKRDPGLKLGVTQ